MVQRSLKNSLDFGLRNGLRRWIRLAKSSDPEKFRRILRQSKDSYDFLGDKSSWTQVKRFLRKILEVKKLLKINSFRIN